MSLETKKLNKTTGNCQEKTFRTLMSEIDRKFKLVFLKILYIFKIIIIILLLQDSNFAGSKCSKQFQ